MVICKGNGFSILLPKRCINPAGSLHRGLLSGTLLFFAGMLLNWQSDYIIRHLRKPGDTRHYLPQKGMYRYVTSANYFGEIVEWAGWAILTCSLSGLVFLWWTIANLVPRANAIWCRYREEFGDAVGERETSVPFPLLGAFFIMIYV